MDIFAAASITIESFFLFHQLFEGEAEVPVDDGQVEPVAVQRAYFFSGLNHLAQILENFFFFVTDEDAE
jgi:hypothetical protein